VSTALAVDRSRLVDLHQHRPDRYPALFESAARHPRIGRRSLLFAFPGEPVVAQPGRNFFGDLDFAHRSARGFGHVVFLGYELLTQVESIAVPGNPGPLPTAFALPVAAAIVVDHEAGTTQIVGAPEAVGAVEADLSHAAEAEKFRPIRVSSIEEDEPGVYLTAVRRAKEYIVAGDIFQANLSREWRARLAPSVGPVDVYRALRAQNPAPFAGIVRFGDAAILSSSPERLLRSDGPMLESRPIAGTRPRTGSDGAMIADLIGNEKERAEHIMLVDLIRNDLGKVARYGSVEVDELMGIESYTHVHHIVSNVRCEMNPSATVGDALAAMFPGGTITGCPKVRCMEIIGELEGVGRGAYTGSLGFVEASGAMDFNILIRTMVWQPGIVRFRAGAGIVADSDPDFELAETRAKARGMLRALGA
jgi:4-amino-4-deoxychorismate synthase (2-amino-4-deoxychorismate-forming) component I